MTPSLRMVTWSTTAAVAVTGLVYGGMLYCLSPEDPNDLVNHAWQPAMQYLHVLAAPVWLVAFGVLWHAHVLPKLQSREAARWRSGIALLVLSVAMAGRGQHQDAGAKVIHAAPRTKSTVLSKSISKDGGRSSYRGLVKVHRGATDSKVNVRCDALLLDKDSRSDTYPTMEVDEQKVAIEHEAVVSKVGDEQMFYLRSRGLSESEATLLIVNGFIEPFTKELPMEYAVELNRLIQLEMEGSVG